jgi:thioredoxin reductase (NADPH)
MFDIIIVGAGPAGMTAGIYALRANKKVLILEAVAYGGKIINATTVENYPAIEKISGFELATNMFNQVKNLGADIRFEKVVDINDLGETKQVMTDKETYECKAIILATGVQTRKLGLAKEEELLGRGISYCATCDGAFYKDRIVAVNGGGNSAVEDALFLADYCRKVYVIYRNDVLRAEPVMVEKLKKCSNVEYIFNANIIALNGEEKLESITLKDKNTNEDKNLNVDALFIAIGQIPENNNFAKLVKLNDQGYIIGDDDCHTNIPGIYVAGDTKEKTVRQLTTATSDGTIAALTAIKEMK